MKTKTKRFETLLDAIAFAIVNISLIIGGAACIFVSKFICYTNMDYFFWAAFFILVGAMLLYVSYCSISSLVRSHFRRYIRENNLIYVPYKTRKEQKLKKKLASAKKVSSPKQKKQKRPANNQKKMIAKI